MSSFHDQTAQFIAAVAQNLPEMSSDVMQGWIKDPKALQKFLLDLCPPVPDIPIPEFKVWRTIKLGTGLKTAEDFYKYFRNNRLNIDIYASDIISKPAFTVAPRETVLNLIVVRVAELGFKKGATREQIFARAKEWGLTLCPAEAGPQLRLQYRDQPNNDELFIAMDPIAGSMGYLSLFKLIRENSTFLLSGYSASPACVWSPSARFVFSRRN